MEKFLHLFLPHPHTHEKAKLLHWHFLLIYILLFVLLRLGINLANIYEPGVLGISSGITVKQIIDDTNAERQGKGLSTLHENQALDAAAFAKAKNMFAENYWAHFAPSGKTPWNFITTAGYKFSYAGENLARNFYQSQDVVIAWMNSPSHRENLLNPNYQDIGVAVVDGVLEGQKTTLVVQMFGTPYEPLAFSAQNKTGNQRVSAPLGEVSNSPVSIAGAQAPSLRSLIDPFAATKAVSAMLVLGVAALLTLDFVVMKRRGVFRLSSHHIAHLGFLALTGSTIFMTVSGQIL